MKQESRLKKSFRNFSFSIFFQFTSLILNFVNRTFFIKLLGAEYLGVNGLFTNILTFLSLAELGIGNAIIYSMYKPLAKHDNRKLAELMNFYKKMYYIIAILIFIFGVLLIPFLPYIVNSNIPLVDLKLYYMLFLLNSIVSYLFAYKSSIFIADQKIYVTKMYALIFLIIQFTLQITILYFTHNYLLYLIIQIICTFGNNILCSIKANKQYPFIMERAMLNKKEKRKIFSNVKSIFIHKISGSILNNSDNILISIMLGTVFVGYYSNYFLIITSLTGLITVLFTSVNASVGNINVENDDEKKYQIFKVLNLISFWIFGYFSVGLILLFNDFITLWIGQEFLLDFSVVVSIVLNFYIVGIMNPIWVYRDTTGLFNDTKVMSLILAILNVILSIVFGHFWGLFGIIFASVISRLCTVFWQQPIVLYKKIFNKKCFQYFYDQIKYLLFVILAILINYVLTKNIDNITVLSFTIKGTILTITTNLLFYIFSCKTSEWKYISDNVLKKLVLKVEAKINGERKN